ncbi:MAG: hypothetical protein AABN34_12930 [Acidobacteriota bacterium]
MSDELTQNLPNSVPETEPTILTLMERLKTMQELMDRRQELADRRHLESQELLMSVRDDINQRAQQKYELLVNRIESLRTETNSHFRKQDHVIHALNDNVLHTRGDQRELFERIAALEEKAS